MTCHVCGKRVLKAAGSKQNGGDQAAWFQSFPVVRAWHWECR